MTIFTYMNQVRYVNPTTNAVCYMNESCERALKSIGFIRQDEPKEPQLELVGAEVSEKKPTTTKKKKNATNN